MKNLLTFVLFISLTYTAQAQGKIAVQEDSVTVAFYTDLATALDSAAPNSTVYLPGGGFILATSYIINKPLNIVGVGYNTDSTQATNQTVLPQIRFGSGADGSSITGCYITGYIDVFTGTSNISIKRCNTGYITLFTASNISITENRIRGNISGQSNILRAKNIFFNKNIIQGYIIYIDQSFFKNNIILGFYDYSNNSSDYSILGVSSCTFNNNYFYILGCHSSYPGVSCTFNNNVVGVSTVNSFSYFAGCIFNNSLSLQSTANTFEGTGSSNSDTYYQIKSTSPALTHATDGGEIGIFGTTKPWKIGGLPDNPHVYFINVADENTGANGTLPVEIGVSGQ